jgi:acetyl-CoA C-acetyltransferase
MDETRIPILVGAGQITQREPDLARALSPMDLTAEAARRAAADAGPARALIDALDTAVVIRSFSDTSWRFKSPFGGPANPPQSITKRIGASNVRRHVYTHPGGNMPQWCVNRLFEMVTRGEVGVALICGGEALATQKAAERAKLALDWREDAGGTFEPWGIDKRGWSDREDRHKLAGAIFEYPLFEMAIRGHLGRSIAEHQIAMGRLFEGFAKVAAGNPHADRRAGYSAETIATPSADNPYIGWPYTKLMNANAFIDQAAALVLTSVAAARKLGIPEEKWIYLHGCADAHDHWYVSDRVNFHSSPAMREVARETLAMAGVGLDRIDAFDLYSCFPSAVEIGAAEMGLALEDPRGLTVTGGLPYFGGPGNNYVTHAIGQMMERLRAKPGTFGLVTANGNYVTKQSAGLYGTTPPDKPFAPRDPAVLQARIDAVRGPEVVDAPSGPVTIETYTVVHDRGRPSVGILFARDAAGRRCIANPPADAALLADMIFRDWLGARGTISTSDGHQTFHPD